MTFRELRLHRGFPSQQSLAKAAGVRQETVSQIETARIRHVRYTTVEALAVALGVTKEAVAAAIEQTEAA